MSKGDPTGSREERPKITSSEGEFVKSTSKRSSIKSVSKKEPPWTRGRCPDGGGRAKKAAIRTPLDVVAWQATRPTGGGVKKTAWKAFLACD